MLRVLQDPSGLCRQRIRREERFQARIFQLSGLFMTGLARPSKKAIPPVPVPSRRPIAPSSSKGLRGLRVEVELALVLRVVSR